MVCSAKTDIARAVSVPIVAVLNRRSCPDATDAPATQSVATKVRSIIVATLPRWLTAVINEYVAVYRSHSYDTSPPANGLTRSDVTPGSPFAAAPGRGFGSRD